MACGGATVALASLVLRDGTRRGADVVAIVALAVGVTALIQPTHMRADATSYFVYLRSLAFDHDLSFANEWARWGFETGAPTATGLVGNRQSIGPAILWAPFFLLAHVYVVALNAAGLGGAYVADGYSIPYWRAAALGTVTTATFGAYLLAVTLKRWFDSRLSVVAVAVLVLSSPIAYYVFALPTMSHGLAFGLAGVGVWLWAKLESQPSVRAWALFGVLVGLLTLVRWQAVVFAVLALVPLNRTWKESGARRALACSAAAAAAAIAVLVPQTAAWKVLYGRWLTMPQGEGFVDWSSPRMLDVFVSADHGLFTWTPSALLGVLGLVLLVARRPGFSATALLVVAINGWVCGGVRDWAASDAFGARRFDFTMPLLAIGLAWFLIRARDWLRARPAVGPLAVGALLVLWNLGFMRLFERGGLSGPAPLATLTSAQVEQGRRGAERLAGALAGDAGRALVYKATVAEYFYENTSPGGEIVVGAPQSPFLLHGWSGPRVREGGPPFRWAHFPEACVRIPLVGATDLPSCFARARAPHALVEQTMTVLVNGQPVAATALGAAWSDHPFAIPRSALHAGENTLCLRFSESLSEAEPGLPRTSAAVALIQLP